MVYNTISIKRRRELCPSASSQKEFLRADQTVENVPKGQAPNTWKCSTNRNFQAKVRCQEPMSEDKKVRNSKDRQRRDNHENDIQLRPMEKDGNKIIEALSSAKMVAVLSKLEIMYVFAFRHDYQCFIHRMDAEEGRRKAFPINERNTAMMKNLSAAADLLFEITPKADMDPIGVMVAAEKGIISYLDVTGQLPAEDVDFMQWQETPNEDNSKGG